MSTTITIPASRSMASSDDRSPKTAASVSFSSSPSPSSYSTSPRSPSSKTSSPQQAKSSHHRRPSLLSSAFAQDECTVINIGDPDGPPRLITYLASSQGFAWNPEIFLPSYIDCDYVPLENRRDPVHEITLSDEEMKNMLPS